MKDSFNSERDGSDVLLQEVSDGMVAYRMVMAERPAASDFESHYEMGKIPRTAYPSYALFGVSMFTELAKLNRMLRTARKRGQDPRIAEVRFHQRDDSLMKIYGIYNERTKYLEVFAAPQELLAMVENVG